MLKQKPKRKSIRLKDFDYSSPEDYFITICVDDFKCIFGEIINGEMFFNQLGKIVHECLLETIKHFSNVQNVQMDISQIMPNHLHLILSILAGENDSEDCRGLINQTPTKERDDRWILMRDKKQTISKIIRHFKAKSTFLAHKNNLDLKWQRSFHDHIIRNQKSYGEIYTYIESNPSTWDRDRNNPKNIKL